MNGTWCINRDMNLVAVDAHRIYIISACFITGVNYSPVHSVMNIRQTEEAIGRQMVRTMTSFPGDAGNIIRISQLLMDCHYPTVEAHRYLQG